MRGIVRNRIQLQDVPDRFHDCRQTDEPAIARSRLPFEQEKDRQPVAGCRFFSSGCRNRAENGIFWRRPASPGTGPAAFFPDDEPVLDLMDKDAARPSVLDGLPEIPFPKCPIRQFVQDHSYGIMEFVQQPVAQMRGRAMDRDAGAILCPLFDPTQSGKIAYWMYQRYCTTGIQKW